MTAHKRNWEFLVFTEITEKPYVLHNVPVLALPEGLTYRFRYRRDDFALHSWSPDQLQGKWGVLVLRDKTIPEFIPVRECRVEQVNEQGEIVFLELAFDRYVVYEPSLGPLDRQPHEAVQDALADRVGAAKSRPLDKYVVDIPESALAKMRVQKLTGLQDYTEAWQALAGILAAKPQFEAVRFFRVTGLRAVGARQPLEPQKVGDMLIGYVLKGGRTYCLDVVHIARRDTMPAQHDITIGGSDQFFQFPKDRERADGRYDIIKLMLYAKPQPVRTQPAMLILESQQELPETPQETASQRIPPVLIPVDIKWTWGTWASKLSPLGFFALGLLIILNTLCLVSSTTLAEDFWQLLGALLIGIAINNWSLLTDLLGLRLK